MPVKNIIFDLGGVIIDIEPERSMIALERFTSGDQRQSIYQHKLFHELETGQITATDFRIGIKSVLDIDVSDADIDGCMNAMLGVIPTERIELLRKMKKRYNTYLISNTNPIHYEAVANILYQIHGARSFDTFFHKTYYSHLEGLKKPDVRIFEKAIRENNLIPEETLYLDDTGEHLQSAQTLGIRTIKVTNENTVVDILKDF